MTTYLVIMMIKKVYESVREQIERRIKFQDWRLALIVGEETEAEVSGGCEVHLE